MTTNAQVLSPTLEQVEETIEKMEMIWQLVPRSARAMGVHKKVHDDVEKILRLVHRFLATRSVQLQTAVAAAAASQAAGAAVNGASGATSEDDGEEIAPLPFIMRQLRLLSPEQELQILILLKMRRLSDEGRLEVFQELETSHHLDCGGELFDDEEHVCEQLDDEGGEAEDEAADGALTEPVAPAESGLVLPALVPNHEPQET